MKKRLFKPELRLALEAMAKGKAPRPNGIIVEFFLSMWLVIGHQEYTKMIHDAILNDYFPHNVTRGLITLLHKGGERKHLSNWRPITLLNVSHTIFIAKVL
jgi:hypothetical protein